jgi:hypothetical protein
MGEVGQVIAGFEHCGIHQRWQRRVVSGLEGLERDLQCLGLQPRERSASGTAPRLLAAIQEAAYLAIFERELEHDF